MMLKHGWNHAFAAAVTLTLFANETAAQKILQQKDSFSGATEYFTEMREAKLEGGSFISGRYVTFRFEAPKPSIEADRPYFIVVRTQTPSWVFISAGPSLILKLDGAEIMTLTGPGSSKARTVIGADVLAESALWQLSQSQLDRLARAKKVEFRIVGDQQMLTGEWKPDIVKDAAYFAVEAPKILHPEAPLVAMLVDAAKTQSQQSCAPTNRAPLLGPPVRLGVNMVAVNNPIADFLHMPAPQGLFVAKVAPGSAAEGAGIKPGDILVRFGETELMSQCDLFAALAATPSGSTIPITALRENNSWLANVTLQADANTQTAQAPLPGTAADATRPTDIYNELTKLDELRRKGILTDAEFEAQKTKILNSK